MNDSLNRLRRLAAHDNFPILVLLLFNLLVGMLLVTHYGESWDERAHYQYGLDSLRAYLGQAPAKDLELDDKGPSYAMLAVLGTEALEALSPGWRTMEAWHFIHFLSFLLGLFFLYRLCLRVAGKWAAFGATLLLNTQPLLWGHAFINPKDISFMAFFLGSIELGVEMQRDSTDSLTSGARSLIQQFGAALSDWRLFLAAVFLGLASSMRVLGPTAGLLVGAYLLAKDGWRSIPRLTVYYALGGAITILTWPKLWQAPLNVYLQTFRIAAKYPWEGKVLFAGIEYNRDELPRSYLPTLISLQFTEPVLLLFVIGLILAAYLVFKKRLDWRLAGLLAAWLFIPLLGVILLRPPMFDNFRHFFFIIPPIFVFGALSLDRLFGWLRRPALSALALGMLAAPGILAIVQLHPYQYVFYNQLAGGGNGAFRRYEMDYWLTSYREATSYLNTVATPQAEVVVWGAPHLVKRYDRGDLSMLDYRKLSKDAPPPVGYAVITSRHNKDQTVFPDAPVLFSVVRDGAVLAVVKQLQPGGDPGP